MAKYEIEIPDGVIHMTGWRPVAFRHVTLGEYYLTEPSGSVARCLEILSENRLIVEPIPKPRVPMERDDFDNTCEFMDVYDVVFPIGPRNSSGIDLGNKHFVYAELADPANGWRYRRGSGPWGPVSKESP